MAQPLQINVDSATGLARLGRVLAAENMQFVWCSLDREETQSLFEVCVVLTDEGAIPAKLLVYALYMGVIPDSNPFCRGDLYYLEIDADGQVLGLARLLDLPEDDPLLTAIQEQTAALSQEPGPTLTNLGFLAMDLQDAELDTNPVTAFNRAVDNVGRSMPINWSLILEDVHAAVGPHASELWLEVAPYVPQTLIDRIQKQVDAPTPDPEQIRNLATELFICFTWTDKQKSRGGL
jgi:hypothetical protein